MFGTRLYGRPSLMQIPIVLPLLCSALPTASHLQQHRLRLALGLRTPEESWSTHVAANCASVAEVPSHVPS